MRQMWQDLRQRLGLGATDSSEDDGCDDTVAFATAALLIEMSQSDFEEHPDEQAAVRRALAKTFQLPAQQIEALIERAHQHRQDAVSYYPHVTLINESLNPAEKEKIVRQLWRVALADGRLDKYEEHYLRKLCELIHVPHRVFIQTKHEVCGDIDTPNS